MKAQTQTVTANGATPVLGAWMPVDLKASQFQIGFGVTVTGTITYTVQHTYDNPQLVVSPTPWDHTVVAAKSAAAEGSYSSPVTAIRLKTTAGTGTATIIMIQAGPNG